MEELFFSGSQEEMAARKVVQVLHEAELRRKRRGAASEKLRRRRCSSGLPLDPIRLLTSATAPAGRGTPTATRPAPRF